MGSHPACRERSERNLGTPRREPSEAKPRRPGPCAEGGNAPFPPNQKLTLARFTAGARSDGTQSDDKAVAPLALRRPSSRMCARRLCDKVTGKSDAGQSKNAAPARSEAGESASLETRSIWNQIRSGLQNGANTTQLFRGMAVSALPCSLFETANAMRYIMAALILTTITPSATLYAHPGRTAADGCHNDRQNGGRHCHGGNKPAPKAQRLFGGDVYYPNCAAARAAGAAPVRAGQPGYARHLDRDGDGVGCE